MATKTARKGNTKKGAAKKGGAKKQATATSNGNGGSSSRRSRDEVRALVPQFVKALQGGSTMKEVKQQFGFSGGQVIREALAAEGYDSKGNKLSLESITDKGAKLTKRLVAERQAGVPWYILSTRTGKPESELRALVEEAGGPASGRVYNRKEKAAKAATAKKGGAKKSGGAKKRRATRSTEDPSA